MKIISQSDNIVKIDLGDSIILVLKIEKKEEKNTYCNCWKTTGAQINEVAVSNGTSTATYCACCGKPIYSWPLVTL